MATQIKENTGSKNLPEAKFKAGAISATVWKNAGVRDGQAVEFRTISIDRRYMDKNNAWQSTSSMRLNDLPKAVVVLQRAYEFLVLKEQDNSGEAAI